MKVVKKNVYYCDHCNKKGLVAIHIRKHESRCTANPNRICGCCESRGELPIIVSSFKDRFTLSDNPMVSFQTPEDIWDPNANYDEKLVAWIGEPITLDEIRDRVDGCPACMLAVLRQTGLNLHYFHLDKFDFKGELSSWMRDQNMLSTPYGY